MSTHDYNRTAGKKLDPWQEALGVIQKSRDVKYQGFTRIVTRMAKILRAEGIELDIKRSQFTDDSRLNGVFFMEPDATTNLGLAEVKKLWEDLFDVHPRVQNHGNGWRVELA